MSADGMFLITDGESLVEMAAAPCTSEEVLQELLARYPKLLAGGPINPSTPRRWLLVAREVGGPARQAAATTGRWTTCSSTRTPSRRSWRSSAALTPASAARS